MFIQTEETPNPNSLKFIPDNKIVLNSGTIEFKNQKQAATKSPLALQLFEISGIESIFLGHNFITITKNEKTDWSKIKTEIQATIMDFFVSQKPVLFEEHKPENNIDENDSDIVKQIKELIEVKVRPAVAMDGGDIIFHSFEDGIVKLHLKGSCSGCPSSTITLKNGIENMLKHYIPEVEAVEQIDED
ncbi:MAG: NifU family protein [Rickettsiales bacterium]|nr:NifU family protein [Rickettsiales bacterium]